MDYFRDDSTSTFLMGVATGLAVGALAMFVFDPQQGRRRRAIAREKAMHYGREAGKIVSTTSQDLKNRAYGLAKEAESMAREQMGTEAGTGTLETR